MDIGRIFDALGDPTRRAIVDSLRQGPLSVSSLAGPLQISLAAVGQHLQLLEETGLVHVAWQIIWRRSLQAIWRVAG